MSPQRIRWLAIFAALAVIIVGYLSLNRTVTILADGEAHIVTTKAITVGGALQAAGLSIGPQDSLEPASYALLSNDSIIAINRAAQVHLLVDGEQFSTISTDLDPKRILEDFGIELAEDDRLLLAGSPVPLNENISHSSLLALEIRRAQTLTIQDGDATSQILSSALTVGEALADAGVVLLLADRVEPGADSMINGDTSVKITRAQPLEIVMGDERIELRTAASTVGEALAEVGISLQGLDFSEPAEEQEIPGDRTIRVVRVQETVQLQTQSVPFTVEWQPDPETEIDGRSVIQLGQNGLRASSIRVRYEDGEEVSRVEETERVLSEPVTQISGYGTQIVVRSAVVDGVEIEYWRALELFATSYSPCRSGVEACYYYTALGDEVKQGIAAVYLSWWYAMGQHTVYVPGYGPAKISDNGAYPDGRPWIDLGYSDDDWVSWGDWVTVYFTTPIPPANEILYILP
jgi:uncharacterized protein YabE (DUF348 family)